MAVNLRFSGDRRDEGFGYTVDGEEGDVVAVYRKDVSGSRLYPHSPSNDFEKERGDGRPNCYYGHRYNNVEIEKSNEILTCF